MTSLQQRGYDDQMAGKPDPVLEVADTVEARQYRDGLRAARRDQIEERCNDMELGPALATQRTEPLAIEPTEPPPITLNDIAPSLPDTAIDIASTPGAPNAFFDPPPKKPRKPKPADDAQLGLF